VSVARYAAIVVLAVVATMAALLAALRDHLGSSGVAAVLTGAALAALNSVAAYWLVAWSARRSTTWFFRAILGGMLARMAFMLAAVVAGILLLGLPSLPLVFALLGYFVPLLAFEVTVVSRRLARAPAPAEAS
jgi:hypothetical protein